jgi:MFS family permease
MVEFFNTRRDSLAVASIFLALLMTGLDTSIANTSLPELARVYGASFAHAQWIVLAYLLAVTSLTVVAGRLGDLLGRRRIYLTGLALFTVSSLVCAAAPSLWWLVTARAIQGACAAATVALSYALIGDIPHASAERTMGQLAAMSAAGTTLGPAIGSVVGHFAPSAIFLVNVPFGALAFALAFRYLPHKAPCARGAVSFDAVGTLLLALSLLAYALSMTLGALWRPLNAVLLLGALCGAGVFVAVELRAASPLVPVAMFRNAAFSASLASSAMVATVVIATLIVGPFYLTHVLVLGRAQAGLILSCGPAAAALTATLAGRVVEELGFTRAAIAGLLVMGVGSFLLALLPASTGAVGYALPLVVMTSGYATFQTANNTAALAHVGSGRRGVAAGLLTLSRNVGQITGAAVLGAAFLHATGASALSAASSDATALGMRITMAIATGLIAIALLLTLLTRLRGSPSSLTVPQPRLTHAERHSSC